MRILEQDLGIKRTLSDKLERGIQPSRGKMSKVSGMDLFLGKIDPSVDTTVMCLQSRCTSCKWTSQTWVLLLGGQNSKTLRPRRSAEPVRHYQSKSNT